MNKLEDLRLGLVVQGGAMRTVYAAGALAELERQGIRPQITAYSGNSGGGLAMLCFATGNAGEGEELFIRTLANRKFINPRRLRPIVDIDYLVRDVVANQIIGNLDESLRGISPCIISATHSATARPVSFVINRGTLADPTEDVLVASAAIPVLYGRKIPLSVGDCVDGGITDAIPLFPLLLHDRFDAVLVIKTRPIGEGREVPISERLALHLDRTVSGAVRRSVLSPNSLYAMTEATLAAGSCGGTPIITISPRDRTALVSRTTTDHDELRRSAAEGSADARAVIDRLRRQ